jgi:hypothetical protein
VYVKRTSKTIRPVFAAAVLVAGASLCGCGGLAQNNYFLPGGINPNSPVAAQVGAAERAPGPYPHFSQIPPLPTDVRSSSAWRSTVSDTLAQKRQAETAAYPFSLNDTEGFAQAARSRIPPAEAVAPSDDSAKAADDYAARVRGRATTPPPPQ